jgi:hypothetical protein
MNNNLYIVSVATEIKYYMKYLIESIEKNNGKLTVLGFGEEWKGFNWRFKMTIEFLKKINPMDIVCFVDGYDVVCTRNLNSLIDTFKNIQIREKCKIIVGHDKVVNPLFTISQYFLFGKCKNDFINAGTYIGYAKDLLDILQFIQKDNSLDHMDDQILLTNYCSIKPNDIYIDLNNEIFLVLGDAFNDLKKDITFSNNELIYKGTKKPYFIHSPCTYLDNIILNIGCNHTDGNTIQTQIYNDYWNKKIYTLLSHFLNEKKEMIIIVILLIFIIFYVICKKK